MNNLGIGGIGAQLNGIGTSGSNDRDDFLGIGGIGAKLNGIGAFGSHVLDDFPSISAKPLTSELEKVSNRPATPQWVV